MSSQCAMMEVSNGLIRPSATPLGLCRKMSIPYDSGTAALKSPPGLMLGLVRRTICRKQPAEVFADVIRIQG